MSSDDVNLAAPADEPLWVCTYAGPARADGGPRRRIQLTRDGMYVNLSVEEWARLGAELRRLNWPDWSA